MLVARKLQRQATSGAASDISASLSVRSMASSRQLAPSPSPPPPPWWSKWLGLTAVLHLANTYYASRMVLVTLTSFLSLVLLCIFANKSDVWIWIWILFLVTNMALGVSALPYIQLFSAIPTDTTDTDADADSQTTDTDNNTNKQTKPGARGASFSFLRSSLYAFEAQLEPFHLQRSTVLRICETIVVVQSVLLYLVLLVVVLTIFVQREQLWHESSVFTTETALGLLAVVCAVLQTKAFDRLRSHEQFQLGVGLEPEQLDPPTTSRRRPGSSDQISIVLQARESRDNLRSRLDSGHSSSSANHGLTPPPSNNKSVAQELDHTAGLVEQELRRGLYEAAVARDVPKARALLEVMERVLGSQVKVELLLLKMYATPTLWLWGFAFTTHNPLHVACRLGDDAMVETLLVGGLNPNLLDKTHGAPLSLRLLYDLCQGRGRELTNVLGAPLHVAVAHGHGHVVDKLVQHGASLDVVAHTSWFSRSMRVPAIFLADSSDVLSCLIHHRANFLLVPGKNSTASTTLTVLQRVKLNGRSDLEAVLKDWGGDVALTPLHEMAAAGDLVTVKHYLSLGIPPDQRGEFQDGVFQRTPLHWASIMGRTAVVRELLAHGSDIHAVDSYGRSPLHWASRHNHVDTVDALLSAGADPHAVDDDGLTPLAFAAEGGLLTSASVELMMNYGVDVNAATPNDAEDTCLHLALRRGHQDAALALLTTGKADLNVANADGLRAIECCASSELQFAAKECSGWVDVVLSFDVPYRVLAQRVKEGIEASFLTVFLRNEAQGRETAATSMDVMREASAVVCVLSPGFEHSAACMEELAFAKLLQLPVVALTTEAAAVGLPEELQVYLFTRQLVPLRDAVAMKEDGHGGITFTIDDAKFQRSVQNLIDGLRDEVERHRVGGRGGGAMGSGGDPLEDEDGRDTRSMTMSMDVRRTTSSEATSTTVAMEETKDGDAVALRVRMNRTVSPRPSGVHKQSLRSLQDVMRDVVQRRRHHPQNRPTNGRRASLFALSSLSVFVSHGDCHSGLVAQLCEELRQLDVVVTLDSMAHVSSMKERILAAKDAILSCDVFLVILSKESVQTELVNDQLAFAEDKGKPIVPVHVTKRPSVVTSSLRQALDRSGHALHVIADDFTYGRGLDELLAIVRSQPSTVHTTVHSEAAARIAHRLAIRAHPKMAATATLHQF